MNCQQVDKYLYDYCDHILTPEQQSLFEQHLAACHSCRQVVDQALLETSILREEWDTPDLPADFTSRVMEQIATKPIPRTRSVAADGKRRWQRWFMGVATAAAVLLMVVYAPGMIKNEKIINIADQEKIASEPAGDKVKIKSPANTQYKDVLMGGKGEETGTNEYLLSLPEHAQFDSAEVDKNSPAPVPKNEPNLYGANDSAVSDAAKKSIDQQSNEGAMVASKIITVQPVNLPASYTMVDKLDGTDSCTYIFGTGINKDSLTINIAQLPLHRSGQSSYSRSYVRPTSTADAENKTVMPPADQICPGTVPGHIENETEKAAVEEAENVEILTKELKADTTATESPHTISYEVVHNNQTYLLTITANLSPEELVALSQNLQLQSTTP